MNIDEYNAMVKAESDKTTQQLSKASAEDEGTTTAEAAPEYIEIDGEKVTLDELKKGYLRQSDYTRKTQALAQQRKDNEAAVKLYEQLNGNPELTKVLQENDKTKEVAKTFDPLSKQADEIKQLKEQIALDRELSRLSKKYKDFDEIAVLTAASEKNTTDLEAVYKELQDSKDKNLSIDELRAQIRKELETELQANDVGMTLITGRGGTPPSPKKQVTLTESETKIARAFGMTADEYVKFKSTQR